MKTEQTAISISTYKPVLDFTQTQKGIELVKAIFSKRLSEKLGLIRVTAPRFLTIGTGLQDDLAMTQEPVRFKAKAIMQPLEITHSLAKWKRQTLGTYGFSPSTGILTEMDAVRKDEDVDDIHSIYVDQWDWEKVIRPTDKTLDFLKQIVRKIYAAIKETEQELSVSIPELKQRLPPVITFLHTEDLEKEFPSLTPKQREFRAAKKYGAVFIIGIGHPLKSGKPHDLRAADYDDWSTPTFDGKRGLDGDIIVWDTVREDALELSSMGIRVDKKALLYQLKHLGLEERMHLPFHKGILKDEIPLSIGGGIGQSRLCMLFLQKKHIGEVQSSAWPEEIIKECREKRIPLL